MPLIVIPAVALVVGIGNTTVSPVERLLFGRLTETRLEPVVALKVGTALKTIKSPGNTVAMTPLVSVADVVVVVDTTVPLPIAVGTDESNTVMGEATQVGVAAKCRTVEPGEVVALVEATLVVAAAVAALMV